MMRINDVMQVIVNSERLLDTLHGDYLVSTERRRDRIKLLGWDQYGPTIIR